MTEKQYAGLLAARTTLAGFLQGSERDARAAGTTHAQHHVLLALRGHPTTATAPTVKDIAAALGVASPTAVELIARMVTADLLRRHDDPTDHRRTRLRLTPHGRHVLRTVSEGHLPKLRDLHHTNTDHLGD